MGSYNDLKALDNEEGELMDILKAAGSTLGLEKIKRVEKEVRSIFFFSFPPEPVEADLLSPLPFPSQPTATPPNRHGEDSSLPPHRREKGSHARRDR